MEHEPDAPFQNVQVNGSRVVVRLVVVHRDSRREHDRRYLVLQEYILVAYPVVEDIREVLASVVVIAQFESRPVFQVAEAEES